MSVYDRAFDRLMALEGGYTVDHAGPTNYGITLPTLRSVGLALGDLNKDGVIDAEDVRLLTPVHSKEIYRILFWNKYNYASIQDEQIAIKVFEMTVNCGPSASHRAVQRACRANSMPLLEDGVLGSKSLSAINAITPARSLLTSIRSEIAGYYRLILSKHPEFEQYRAGWLRRAYS